MSDRVCLLWSCFHRILPRPVKSDGTSKLSSQNKSGSIDIEHAHHVTVNLGSSPLPSSGQRSWSDKYPSEVTWPCLVYSSHQSALSSWRSTSTLTGKIKKIFFISISTLAYEAEK